MKSDISISPDLTYCTFPFPEIDDSGRKNVEDAAELVLAARANHPEANLAQLYDPLSMPQDLVKAHGALNGAVDALYGKRKFTGEADRLEVLFARYAELTADLLTEKPVKKTRKKKLE